MAIGDSGWTLTDTAIGLMLISSSLTAIVGGMLAINTAIHSARNRKEYSMAYEAYPKSSTAFRVVLESYPEGVYVFVFQSEASAFTETDMLQDTLEMAKLACEQDFGVKPEE